MTAVAHWNKESVYNDEIAPLMRRIVALCREHDIPVVATFQYGHSEEGAALDTTVIITRDDVSPHLSVLAHALLPDAKLADMVQEISADGVQRGHGAVNGLFIPAAGVGGRIDAAAAHVPFILAQTILVEPQFVTTLDGHAACVKCGQRFEEHQSNLICPGSKEAGT